MKKYSPVNWEIEHPCPQCGAPITLGETDRILSCSYCRTKQYLLPKDYFRYYLPPADQFPEDSIFIPYWRLKGMVFFFKAGGPEERVLDLSSLASHHAFLPPSLGLRPQVLKLRFVSPEMRARFFDPHIPLEVVVRNASTQVDLLNDSIHPSSGACKAFIGESASLIYSPIFIRGEMAHDGILGKPLAPVPKNFTDGLLSSEQQKDSQIKFISTLCPRCGWDLLGEKNCVVLFCKNCDSAWTPSQAGFQELPWGIIPSTEVRAFYLPFWRMSVQMEGDEIPSDGDLKNAIKTTPVMEEEGSDRRFWSPAFKVPPHLFLRLTLGMTASQPGGKLEGNPPWSSLYPVTLPVSEAVQTVKLTLAHSIRPSPNTRNLDELHILLKESLLIYVPFVLQGIDFVQPHTRLSIPKNSLELGRVL